MPDAAAQAPTALAASLRELEEQGARRFDADACSCLHQLLAHAEELPGAAGARLSQRAAQHLSALEARFARERARVSAALTAAERRWGALPELRRRAAEGDLTGVARALRRLNASGDQARPRTALGRAAPDQVQRRRQSIAYEDSLAQLVAVLALARATDGIPADAGPYNPVRIASEVLDRMRAISPFYLTVQLNRLEELASLLSLPELPTRTAPSQPPAKRRPKPGKRA